jgi:hypothetical protein
MNFFSWEFDEIQGEKIKISGNLKLKNIKTFKSDFIEKNCSTIIIIVKHLFNNFLVFI